MWSHVTDDGKCCPLVSPGSQVSPVCVPDEDEELNDGWSCVTTGWGATKAAGSLT